MAQVVENPAHYTSQFKAHFVFIVERKGPNRAFPIPCDRLPPHAHHLSSLRRRRTTPILRYSSALSSSVVAYCPSIFARFVRRLFMVVTRRADLAGDPSSSRLVSRSAILFPDSGETWCACRLSWQNRCMALSRADLIVVDREVWGNLTGVVRVSFGCWYMLVSVLRLMHYPIRSDSWSIW